jgi:hypothetical protein
MITHAPPQLTELRQISKMIQSANLAPQADIALEMVKLLTLAIV